MKKTSLTLIVSMIMAGLILGGCKSNAAKETKPVPAPAKTAPAPSAAQPAQSAPAPAAPAAPVAVKPLGESGVLSCDKPVHEFGDSDPKATIEGTFTLKNTGKEVLNIDKTNGVHAECSCTLVALDKYALQPGETATLKSQLHLPEYPGPVDKGVRIDAMPPSSGSIRLAFKGTVKKLIAVQPEKYDFEARDSAKNKIPLVLESTDKAPFKVLSINATPALKFTFDPNHSAARHEIPVQVDSKMLLKTPSGTITVTIDHPKVKSALAQFTTVLPFKADPGSVYWQNLDPGQSVNKVVKLISNYGEKLNVTAVRSERGLVEITRKPELAADGSSEFEVTLTTPKDSKSPMIFDRILVDIEGYGKDAMAITCYARLKMEVPYGAK